MRRLITLAFALSAALAFALTAPPQASACTGCPTTFEEFVRGNDRIVLVRYAGRTGGRFVYHVADVLKGQSPAILRFRFDPVGRREPPRIGSRWLISTVRPARWPSQSQRRVPSQPERRGDANGDRRGCRRCARHPVGLVSSNRAAAPGHGHSRSRRRPCSVARAARPADGGHRAAQRRGDAAAARRTVRPRPAMTARAGVGCRLHSILREAIARSCSSGSRSSRTTRSSARSR